MAIDPTFTLSRRRVLGLSLGGFTMTAIASSPLAAFAQTIDGRKAKIATIGAGREGGALGTLFAKEGHEVMFSSRNPDQLKELVASAGASAQAGTVAQAVAFGDVVFVVVPYSAVEQIGRDFGAALVAKPLVFDVSNPIARRDGDALVDWVAQQGGAGLATAKLLPGAHLVRGFNAIGSGGLKNAHRSGELLGVPIASDDQAATALASGLIKEIGFEPVLVGGLAMGKYLVPGTPLAGEHTAAELRQIAGKLT